MKKKGGFGDFFSIAENYLYRLFLDVGREYN